MSHSETETLLAQLWPDGIPTAEAALLRALPEARAAVVQARIAAIVAVENGDPVAAAAASLGMDRVAFYRLRRRWEETRSLRALTPFAGKATRRIAAGVVPNAAMIALDVVRTASPNASARSMALTLIERAKAISEPTSLRLVREARMSLSADSGHLARTFGAVTLFDLSAVSLAVSTGSHVAMTPIVAVVMDRSSRLVLGHAAGLPDEMRALQRTAVSLARAALADHTKSDGPPGESLEIEFVLPEGGEDLSPAIRLAVPGPFLELAAGGARRFGQRLISLTGHRLGRLRLRPRATSPSSPWNGSLSDVSHPPMSPDDAIALINEAVGDHNFARLMALSREGETGDRPADPVQAFLIRMAEIVPAGRLASLEAVLARVDVALRA